MKICIPGFLPSGAQFLDIYFPPPLNVSVISVRGTDVGRTIDLLEDAKLWIEPVSSPEHGNVVFGIEYCRNSPENAIVVIITCTFLYSRGLKHH